MKWLSLKQWRLRSLARRTKAAPVRLRVEGLEERTVPAVSVASLAAVPGLTAGGSIDVESVSDDGNYVVFSSSSGALAANDANATTDVFLYNRSANSVTLVSHNAANTGAGNNQSYNPIISGDGKFIAFNSDASDLVANDTNFNTDVFVYDRVNGTIALASRNSAGTNSGNDYSYVGSISADGGFIAFSSYSNNLVANDFNGNQDAFVYDRAGNSVALVSRNFNGNGTGAGYSYDPQISGDGKYVAFASNAFNLVNNDTNGSYQDVFVYDRINNSVALVSVNSAGNGSGNSDSYEPSISFDGTFITYHSYASDLAANDTNGNLDVFLYIRPIALNLVVSRNLAGTGTGNNQSYGPQISADGKFIAFNSFASDLVGNDSNNSNLDVFLYDRVNNTIAVVSGNTSGGTGNSSSSLSSISSDGGVVGFVSSASDLINNDTNGGTQDAFVYDRTNSSVALVSRNSAGTGSGNNSSFGSIVSGNGNFVAYSSNATDMTASDFDSAADVFLYNRLTPGAVLASKIAPAQSSITGGGSSSIPSTVSTISSDGRYLVYQSSAPNLAANDTNGTLTDIFLFDRDSLVTTLVSHNSGNTGSGNNSSSSPSISADGNFFHVHEFCVRSGGQRLERLHPRRFRLQPRQRVDRLGQPQYGGHRVGKQYFKFARD